MMNLFESSIFQTKQSFEHPDSKFISFYVVFFLTPCWIFLLLFICSHSVFLLPLSSINYVGNKKQNQNGYSTWDPRKAKQNGTGEVPQYDEIPYGDVGPSGKGQLPQVPAEYSQVPQVPQRQGTPKNKPDHYFHLSSTNYQCFSKGWNLQVIDLTNSALEIQRLWRALRLSCP